MLLDGGADPLASNGTALPVAINHKRSDIAELLLDRGVPVSSVDFESIYYSADPKLIQLFLDRGANPVAIHPVYPFNRSLLSPRRRFRLSDFVRPEFGRNAVCA